MAKVVRFHRTGDADVLQFEDLPPQEPGEGEVRIKVEAIGLNRAEVLFRQGNYVEAPVLPSRLGYEAAGVVDAVGPNVTAVKVGDRVSTMPAFSMRNYGVYGEYAVVPAQAAAPWPEGLTAVEAASVWVAYLTAYGPLVEYSKLRPGDAVLITAASSSVGYAALQIAKAIGATTIATTRTSAKKDMLRSKGADHVVATQEEVLPARVEEITGGRGAAVVFDAVAGPSVEVLAKSAAEGATIFLYGALAAEPTLFPFGAALTKGLSVRGYTLWEIVKDPGKRERCQRYVYAGLKSGALRPVIDRTFPLQEVVEAHRYMESNKQNGKIVLTV